MTASGQGSCSATNITAAPARAISGQATSTTPHAEMRRTDFVGDRDINYDGTTALDDITRCYKYWIALTDCDGFRVDTLKHVDEETGRNFCGSIKEFAANLGKSNFF